MAPTSSTETMALFSKARERLGSPEAQSFQEARINLLRDDINAFRSDLAFLDSGGTIILAPDAAEIGSYLQPQRFLGLYCFPLEDSATFDINFAKSEDRRAAFSEASANQKIGRRVLRARAHLFNAQHQSILLPAYFPELDLGLSMILASRGQTDLEGVFKSIEQSISSLKAGDDAINRLMSFATLEDREKAAVLDSIFDRVVANPIIYADDLSLNNKDKRISELVRANDFLLNANVTGIEDYEWSSILGKQELIVIDQIVTLTPDASLVGYLAELFFKLPRGSRTNLSIYADARALGYLAAINDRLRKIPGKRFKLQLVSWASSTLRVARSFWPEPDGRVEAPPPLVEVRHPKLLAAAIDFTRVDRNQVVADLERFASALSLYGGTSGGDPSNDRSLSEVRNAWIQLDNTLLAWTSKIDSSSVPPTVPVEEQRLAAIRQAVSEHRKPFEDHLVAKIDRLSKSLSDSHWSLVRPQNPGDIKIDELYYESNHFIIIRPQTDHARFAIAIYDARIMTRIHHDFINGKAFGYTLAELIATGAEAQRDRAEIQLMKAFLFAVQGDDPLAAQYCRLARSELVKAEFASPGLPEILYLAHYAYRAMGRARRSTSDFRRSLTLLDQSQSTWKPSSHEPQQLLRSRYPISWITTCREIAASELSFALSPSWKGMTIQAYRGCLLQLDWMPSSADDTHLKLESYQTARAAQNVMFAFLFNKYNIGTWRQCFGDLIQPTEEEALRAWTAMGKIRASPHDWNFLQNMTRNDLAFAVGECLFDGSELARDEAWGRLLKLRSRFGSDSTMQRIAEEFVRAVRRSRR